MRVARGGAGGWGWVGVGLEGVGGGAGGGGVGVGVLESPVALPKWSGGQVGGVRANLGQWTSQSGHVGHGRSRRPRAGLDNGHGKMGTVVGSKQGFRTSQGTPEEIWQADVTRGHDVRWS